MKTSQWFFLLRALAVLGLADLSLEAAPIPGLFGTGVNDAGDLLPAGALDPHYKLIASADTNFPGPDSIVVNQDFPIAGEAGGGPWLTNGPGSKWIAPQPDQTCCGVGMAGGNGGNLPGDYVYRVTFDLSGFDLSTVKLTGRWAVDSEGVDIKINGTSTGNKIPPYPPQPSEAWHSFAINSGFVDGMNTLDFVVNRSSGKYPTGLRAEVSGTGVPLPQPVPVPGLFGTGLNDAGALLAAGAVDPHYKLIKSADTNFPGPNSIVVNQDFPIAGEAGGGPWLTNGPGSKWIAPQPDQTCCGVGTAGGNGGNLPGDYVYRITFDLSGFDLSTVKLTGRWAVDSEGVDIKINGTSTGNKIPPYPPQPSEAWHSFAINSGFVDGMNTLDFVVNRSSGKYPTGLRAEVSATGLLFPKVPGLFGTGVSDAGALLAAGAVDPHYKLIVSADTNFPGPNSIVVNQDFPIAGEAGGGPWLTNGPGSKWIGPQPDQTCCGVGTAGGNGGNLPGDYIYRITFDLSGLDLSTVKLTGRWAVDSEGVDIKVNGTSTGNKIPPYPPQPSEAWHSFAISSGFVDGLNTLDFVVNRSSGKYPTGLRAEVSGTATKAGGGNSAPVFLVQPKSQAVTLGSAATFLTSVKGSGLTYQWRHNGTNIPGATGIRLEISNIKDSDLGVYDVVAANAAGSATSDPASLSVATAIPGLFNTGVDASRQLLADGVADPHYTLIVSPDAAFPGPDAFVVNAGPPIVPDGTWQENGPDSRWIAPQANQDVSSGGGNAAGLYTYRFTFDLSDFDPATVTLSGEWAVFASLPDAILNGKRTGLQIGPFEPERLLRPFTIGSGFVAGINTLDFVASAAANGVTGLRVQLRGVGGRLPANTRPTILEQPSPQVQSVLSGDSVSYKVTVRGSSPLKYQWRFNQANIPGETNATLVLHTLAAGNAGTYDVLVSNAAGSATSTPVQLTVLGPVPNLFNTGVGSDAKVLVDGAVDPHYQLILNAEIPASKDAIVEDSLFLPAVWVPNSESSKWIGPSIDPVEAPGDYIYRTTFDLTGFDPATVRLVGSWAADNTGRDIVLNGTSTAQQTTAGFAGFASFVLTHGFAAGTNTLDFVMSNAGTDPNTGGFRVDGLRAGALRPGQAAGPSLGFTRSGSDLTLSWAASATGFKLFTTTSLISPNWTQVTAGIATSGDRNTYTVQALDPARFYRLQQ